MRSSVNSQVARMSIGWTLASARDQIRWLGARILDVVRACGAGYAAAAEYEELSKLSKAELERRGIPRGDLPQHVFEALRPAQMLRPRCMQRPISTTFGSPLEAPSMRSAAWL
jgi:hypothetical protein